MILIHKPRRAGKTTKLIKLASKGKYKIIVCHSRQEVDRVWNKILEMEKNKEIKYRPPQPITYEDFLQKRYCGHNIESFLIDNIDIFIQSFALVKVEAITLSKNH